MSSSTESASAELASAIQSRDRKAVASTLNLIEDHRPSARLQVEQLFAALDPDRLERQGQLVGITGPPGVGKSEAVEQIAIEQDRPLIDLRLLLMEPTDLRGRMQ